jgi:hypothetical protein
MTTQRSTTAVRREQLDRGLAALAAVNLGVLAYFVLNLSGHRIGFGPYRIDLDVYRIEALGFSNSEGPTGANPSMGHSS